MLDLLVKNVRIARPNKRGLKKVDLESRVAVLSGSNLPSPIAMQSASTTRTVCSAFPAPSTPTPMSGSTGIRTRMRRASRRQPHPAG